MDSQYPRPRVPSRLGIGPMSRHAADAASEVELADLRRAVARAIDALPERCRLIFTMSREQDLSYAEIARILDISVKTVETQMGRALKALRARLVGYLPIALALASASQLSERLFR